MGSVYFAEEGSENISGVVISLAGSRTVLEEERILSLHSRGLNKGNC